MVASPTLPAPGFGIDKTINIVNIQINFANFLFRKFFDKVNG